VSEEPSTILLCYDGSPQADHAAEVAGRLLPGARAYVLFVWEPVERIIARYSVLAPFMGEEVSAADADVAAEAERVAAAGVERARKAGLDAVAHTTELLNTVWEEVLEVAEELKVDMIVTGTRSLHGLREVIANTLSHHLIQHSPRPVLAIPTPVRDEAS
jgi:nucleotide-binding universal stress UspA family protein